MKRIVKIILGIAAASVFCFAPAGCSKDLNPEGTGFSNVKNPVQDSDISHYGEEVTVSFIAEAEWDAEVVTADGGDWARVKRKRGDDSPGRGSVRVEVDRNKAESSRSFDIYITVQGFNRSLLCSMTQQSSLGAAIDLSLNAQMHEILADQYLWKTEYNDLDIAGQIEKTVPYTDFLDINLKKLGDVNKEDGGFYREYSSLAGERYIYSYIQEIGSATKSVQTRALSQTYGLGMGLTVASYYQTTNGATRCLLLGFVYPDSPAAKAGLQRGDIITGVNDEPLDAENYLEYQQELYYSQKGGTYKIEFERFVDETETTTMFETTVTAAGYVINPVLFAGLLKHDEENINVGYMVLDSFDANAYDIIKGYLTMFQTEGIKDLILDLRFNPGGSVALCRYIMSSIVGQANWNKTFARLVYDKEETDVDILTFGYGAPEELGDDGFGQGPDLGLSRLYVICSENTGSCSEIVIKSLEGIDFPVYTYGSKTEGKNVGMKVERLTYGGRNFEFAPITYWYQNAKGYDDSQFADGIMPDKVLNDQDADYSDGDDISKSFPYETADWGNHRGDAALMWAFMNATTGEDPEFETGPGAKTKAGAKAKMIPISVIQGKPQIGRFGTVVYPAE